jgi:hypothetical protein
MWNPVTDMSPTVDYGNSPCQLNTAAAGNFDWTCQYPGENSPETACEKGLNDALGCVTGGFFGSATNWGGASAIIAKYFPASIIGRVSASLAAFLGIEVLVDILGVLAILQLVLAAIGNDNIAFACYTLLHLNEPITLALQAGASNFDLGVVTAAPTTNIATTVTVSDPANPTCTTTCQGGSCGTYQACGLASSGLDCF